MSQTNKTQIVIGLAVLLLGTAVYFLDRPSWEQTIFVPGDLSLFPLTPSFCVGYAREIIVGIKDLGDAFAVGLVYSA